MNFMQDLWLCILSAILCYKDLTHTCTSADDYVKIMEEALKLVASKMNISEAQVLAEWELQVRHSF